MTRTNAITSVQLSAIDRALARAREARDGAAGVRTSNVAPLDAAGARGVRQTSPSTPAPHDEPWVLVITRSSLASRRDGAAALLHREGVRVRVADLWDPLEFAPIGTAPTAERPRPPQVVLVEALEQLEPARAARVRWKSHPELVGVPIVVAVSHEALADVRDEDGFDDVVLVPYVPLELRVRLRRLARRITDASERLVYGDVVVDLAALEVSARGKRVDLTRQELTLLTFLIRHPDRVFGRSELLTRVWGGRYVGGPRTVDIHVRRLRMKLGVHLVRLETVRGEGYRLGASTPAVGETSRSTPFLAAAR